MVNYAFWTFIILGLIVAVVIYFKFFGKQHPTRRDSVSYADTFVRTPDGEYELDFTHYLGGDRYWLGWKNKRGLEVHAHQIKPAHNIRTMAGWGRKRVWLYEPVSKIELPKSVEQIETEISGAQQELLEDINSEERNDKAWKDAQIAARDTKPLGGQKKP